MVLMVYRVQFISHLRGRSILNLAGTQPSMLFRYCLPAPNQLKHKTLSIPKEATLEKVIPKTKHKWKLTRKRRTRYDCMKCGGVKLKNEYGGWSYYFP